MFKNILSSFFVFLGILFFALIGMGFYGAVNAFKTNSPQLKTDSILFLELDGVIIDGKKFISDLTTYAKKEEIKGVLIQINSPGGVVGPSQEIYSEIIKIRKNLGKPVVVSCAGMAASGGYYVAAAADKIYTNAGSMLGSIGVIMEFANLEKLYSWAKISRYSITSGRYKGAGTDTRAMTADERQLFSNMILEVYQQFIQDIAAGRKMRIDNIKPYADGRILTGSQSVKLGFADKIGTLDDARQAIGEMSGLGEDPELFKPPKVRPDFFDMLTEVKANLNLNSAIKNTFNSNLIGVPLYMVPGVLNHGQSL